MAKGFNVLFVSSEVYPYSKTGGLADVSNSLPQALNSLGNEVRIITPKYGPLDERRLQIHEIKRLKDIGVDVDGKSCKFNIKSSFIHGKNTKAQVYLLENQDFSKIRVFIRISGQRRISRIMTSVLHSFAKLCWMCLRYFSGNRM